MLSESIPGWETVPEALRKREQALKLRSSATRIANSGHHQKIVR